MGIDFSQLNLDNTPQQAGAESGIDSLTLVQACIIAWSYDAPVSDENIAELDEQTVMAVVKALLPGETNDSQKKD